MLTTTCTVLQGSRRATAHVSTASPQERGAVCYQGDVELFPHRYARLRNDDLRQLARNIARKTNAEVYVEDVGVYDWWAR